MHLVSLWSYAVNLENVKTNILFKYDLFWVSQSLSELGQFQNTLKNSFLSGQKKKTNQARSIVFESGGEDSLIKRGQKGENEYHS